MSEFQFGRTQRLTVPAEIACAEGVQGVVTARTAFVGREPEYSLQWPAADTAGPDGMLIMRSAHHVAETVLLTAQPPKMVPADDVEAIVATARQEAVDVVRREYAGDVKRLQSQVATLERSRKRASRRR